jgi:hypothetical protein
MSYNLQRTRTMLVALYMLSTFTVALMISSPLEQSKGRVTSISRTMSLKNGANRIEKQSTSRLYMAPPPKKIENDKANNNPLSEFFAQFRPSVFEPDEPVELDEEIEKALWFDPSPLIKKISLPNIFFGSVLGAVIAVGTIFAPFFLPDDFSFPSGQHCNFILLISEFSMMERHFMALEREIFAFCSSVKSSVFSPFSHPRSVNIECC